MEKIKVYKFEHSKYLPISPFKDRWFIQTNNAWCKIYTNFGVITVKARPPFKLNFRSGPKIVDRFIPHVGNIKIAFCWWVHDVLGHDFDISFETVNEILDQMLELSGISDLKSDIVEFMVSLDDDWFGCKTEEERDNKKLCSVQWGPN